MSENATSVANSPSAPAPVPTSAPAPEAAKPTSDAKVTLAPPEVKTGGAAPAVEDKKVDKPAVEVEPRVSKHFAELERRKAALAEQAKKQAVESESLKPRLVKLEEFEKATSSKNALAILKAAGLTDSDLATALLNGDLEEQKPDPAAAALARVEKLEAELKAERDAKAAEANAKRYAENMSSSLAAIKSGITEKHEGLALYAAKHGADNTAQLIFDTALEVKMKNGSKPIADVQAFIRQVIDGVDAHLAPKKAEAAPAAEAKAEAPKAKADAKEKIVTITNKTNADQPPAVKPSDPEANKKRAIAVLNERLRAKREAFAASGRTA